MPFGVVIFSRKHISGNRVSLRFWKRVRDFGDKWKFLMWVTIISWEFLSESVRSCHAENGTSNCEKKSESCSANSLALSESSRMAFPLREFFFLGGGGGNRWSGIPKCDCSKRGRSEKHAHERKRKQHKSVNERERVQRGTKERKRTLPLSNCRQPRLKQPGLRTVMRNSTSKE